MMSRIKTVSIVIVLFINLFAATQGGVVHAETTSDEIQKFLLGDIITNRENKEEIGYMEEMLAGLITAVPRWIIAFLNLQDINELVFLDNDWVFYTFPTGVFNAADTFYTLIVSATAYLLVLALIGWGIILLSRSASMEAHLAFKDMGRGFVIYILGIWLGSYLFEMIFTINEFLVKLALYGMQSAGIPSDINFLNLFLILQDIPTLGGSIMFFIVVFSIGILNYQYALRMIMLVMLIILFPLCAYASVFPASRKALDIWFREFMSQVFMNGGHAIGYALFLILLKNGASNWTLFAFLMGLPQISGLIRLVLGAPGGVVSGSMGFASAMALTTMLRTSKGGFSQSGGNLLNNLANQSHSPNPSGALGSVAQSGNSNLGGMANSIGKLWTASPPSMRSLAKPMGAIGKMAAMGTAMTTGAIVGGALAGERGAAIGAGGGYMLGNKMSSKPQAGSPILNSSYNGDSHKMNMSLPVPSNASHERAWAVAQQKTPQGYDLKTVQLSPKGWTASMEKPGSNGNSQSPSQQSHSSGSTVNQAVPQPSRARPTSGTGTSNKAINQSGTTTNQSAQVGQRGTTVPISHPRPTGSTSGNSGAKGRKRNPANQQGASQPQPTVPKQTMNTTNGQHQPLPTPRIGNIAPNQKPPNRN